MTGKHILRYYKKSNIQKHPLRQGVCMVCKNTSGKCTCKIEIRPLTKGLVDFD